MNMSRPKSANAASGNKKSTTHRKERDRGNLYKYLQSTPSLKDSPDVPIEKTPIGISKVTTAELQSARKSGIFAQVNEVNTNEMKPVVFERPVFKMHPVTQKFTSFFKDIDQSADIGNEKISSGNINNKAIQQQCDKDFQSYWLSDKSVVKPSDRIKLLKKPDKLVDEPIEEEEEEVEDVEVEVVRAPRPESRFERLRRRKQCKDIIYIDPIAIQAKAEEIKTLTDCKAEYRRSYNDARRGLERGGTLQPVMLNDASTIDAGILIGNPTFTDTTTPADELILSAAASNVGPFFIMEFMKPLINRDSSREITFLDVHEIDISTKMLGDEKCLCLAKALRHTPNVRRLSIAGNALTDVSIRPILEECFHFLGCTSLDVSDNKLDSKSIDLLKEALLSPTCVLQELLLCSSDIDDDECANFVQSLHNNTSLVYLDLSHNAIGKKEVRK